MLAELARTDAHRFRALVPDGDETKALRALTRAREDLVGVRVELANQLRAQLEALARGLSSPRRLARSRLAFLERYPSPADAKGLGPGRLAGFLARHRYCGRRRPDELLERMRAAPAGRAAGPTARPGGQWCSAWSRASADRHRDLRAHLADPRGPRRPS